MRRSCFIISLLFLVFISISFRSDAKFIISGHVRDAASGEELIGANVAILETGAGAMTNTYGYYALSLDPGFYTLVISYVGYVTETRPIQLTEDLFIDVEMAESLLELEEVTVIAEAGNANITRL